jgi:alpha-amylase
VRSALIDCDTLVRGPADARVSEWERADIDGDGRVEVSVRTSDLSITVRPERGGTLTELCAMQRGIDIADVLTRRPEGYHAQVTDRRRDGDGPEVQTIHAAPNAREEGLAKLLEYDTYRRASLLDGLFPAEGELDCLEPWPLALVAIGERAMTHEVRSTDGAVEAVLGLAHPDGVPLAVRKIIRVPPSGAAFEVAYRIDWDGEPLDARWAVQWNLALTAGDAPGRYYDVPGRPSLGSRGRLADQRVLGMVDEWLGGALRLEWSSAADVAWAPVETVSLSEAGFERIYQGSCVLLSWPVALRRSRAWDVSLRATMH